MTLFCFHHTWLDLIHVQVYKQLLYVLLSSCCFLDQVAILFM